MSSPARRRLTLLLVGAALVVVVGGAVWHVLGEERRLGRLVARVLSERTGLEVNVDRARVESSRLVLGGVRIDPASGVEVRIREVEVADGLVALLAPAGRTVSLVASSASITVREGGTGAPDAAAIDRARQQILGLLGWPGGLRVRVLEGELRRGSVTYGFSVRGEKHANGVVDLSADLREAGEPRAAPATSALTIRARVSAPAAPPADEPLDIAIDLAASPARLGALWPEAIPMPSSIATRSTLTLRRGGELTATGRAVVGSADAPAGGADAPAGGATIDYTGRYDARTGHLSLARYAVDWKPGIALEGAAALEADGRFTANAKGTVDGSRVDGRITYVLGGGKLEGEVTAAPFDVRAAAARFGIAMRRVAARRLAARVAGAAPGAITIDARVQALTLDTLSGAPVDAVLTATAAIDHGRDGDGLLRRVETGTLSLARNGQTLMVMTGASRRAALWPLAVEVAAADLARVAPLLPWPASLEGAARVSGELTRDGVLLFQGSVEAELPRARLTAGTPLTLSGLRAHVPISWASNAAANSAAASDRAAKPGSLIVERLSAFGLDLDRVAGSAGVAEGLLLLSDLAWAHDSGRGRGWLELGLDGRPVPLRTRLEGEHVDLAQVVRVFSGDLARVTGRIRYRVNAQYAREGGLVAVAQVTSEEGGQIDIDVIQRLLDAPAVQVESSGLLRRTLQNLRQFDYASLEGELRWRGGAGFMDLSLRGKKRFGIFPAPVEAINVKNMPLAFLTRALTRGTSP